MTQTGASVDVLWTAFRALAPESRDRFLEQMVADVALRQELEDVLDLAVARERASEPVRPLDDVRREIESELPSLLHRDAIAGFTDQRIVPRCSPW